MYLFFGRHLTTPLSVSCDPPRGVLTPTLRTTALQYCNVHIIGLFFSLTHLINSLRYLRATYEQFYLSSGRF